MDMGQMQRVAELVADTCSDDEEAAASCKPKPGSITPLGVRVDRGQGLLSSSGATSTLAEMDAAINSIRVWQQRRDRDVMDIMKRNASAMEEASSAPAVDYGMQEEAEGSAQDHSDSAEDEEADDAPGNEAKVNGVTTHTGAHSSPRQPVRPTSAYFPTNGSRTPSHVVQQLEQRPSTSVPAARCLGSREMELLRTAAGLRFVPLPADAPLSTPGSSRLRPASAGPRFLTEVRPATPSTTSTDPLPRGRLLPPLPSGAGQQAALSVATLSASRHINDELPWQRRTLSRASSSSSGQRLTSPAEASMVETPGPAGSSSGCNAVTELSAKPCSINFETLGQPSKHAANPAAGAAAVSHGQQLLDELEEELRALDEQDTLGQWYNDFEGVLAKMDRLQSGYQVQLGSDTPPFQSDSKQDC